MAGEGQDSAQLTAMLQLIAESAVLLCDGEDANTRLKHEVDARNHDLAEALEQQTATAEVLRIIGSNPTELQPVLDAICQNAARVCGATDANIRLRDGNELVVTARYGSLQSRIE